MKGLLIILAIVALGVGDVIGTHTSQHAQPCIITFDSGGYRYCRLDPVKGAWVK